MHLSSPPPGGFGCCLFWAVVFLLLICCLVCFPLVVEVLCLSLFCCTLLCVFSSFVIILKRKRELVDLLGLVTVYVLWLFLTVLMVGLWCVIVIFPDHIHFFRSWDVWKSCVIIYLDSGDHDYVLKKTKSEQRFGQQNTFIPSIGWSCCQF